MPSPAQQQQRQFSPGINPSPSSSSTSPLLMNSSSSSSSLFLHDGCSSSSSSITSAFTDLFPSLPDQEEDWLEFGWLLDGMKADEDNGGGGQQRRSASSSSATTKAMRLNESISGMGQKMEFDGDDDETAAVDEKPIAMRTRSHLPPNNQRQEIMLRERSQEGIPPHFWQAEQIWHWLSAVDVEMRKQRKFGKKQGPSKHSAGKNSRNVRRRRKHAGKKRRRVGTTNRANNNPPGAVAAADPERPISVVVQMDDADAHQWMVNSNSSSSSMGSDDGAILYCRCRQPYNQFRFYVGCDHCNGWFHAECVGKTEEELCTLDGPFFCPDCINQMKNN